MSNKPYLVYITTSSREEALMIGEHLVEEQLAACVNVINGIFSIYQWQGKIEKAEEAAMIVKTVQSLVTPLSDRVKDLHSYDCPCIVSLPIDGGNQEFLSWVQNQIDNKNSNL